ncbi:D(3) dopamine receptor-like [Ptychodera flava]|uniref:D(3) dopamine receptor-like n=1 Tax=Ptychodera flava TaxID=63121 RepID=UPI00396AA693
MDPMDQKEDSDHHQIGDYRIPWSIGGLEKEPWVKTIYALIAIVGITGNLLVCVVVRRKRSLSTKTFRFIFHLAICDLVTSVFLIALHVVSPPAHISSGVGGQIACKVFYSKLPLWVCFVASVSTLVMMKIERYLAVVHPVKHRMYCTKRVIANLLISTWFVGVFINSFFLYVSHVVNGRCIQTWPSGLVQSLIGVGNILAKIFVPVGITCYCYLKAMDTLSESEKRLRERRLSQFNTTSPVVESEYSNTEPSSDAKDDRKASTSDEDSGLMDVHHHQQGGKQSEQENAASFNQRDERTRSHRQPRRIRASSCGDRASVRNKAHQLWQVRARKQILHMLCVVMVTFVISWVPNQILFLSYNLGANVDFTKWYYHATVMLAFANSCMNPFIYTFKNKIFRVGLRDLLCFKAKRRVESRNDTSSGRRRAGSTV